MHFDKTKIKRFHWGQVQFTITFAKETVVGKKYQPAIQLSVILTDNNGLRRNDSVTIFEDDAEDSAFVSLFLAANAETEADLINFAGTAQAWQSNDFTRMKDFKASQPAPAGNGQKMISASVFNHEVAALSQSDNEPNDGELDAIVRGDLR